MRTAGRVHEGVYSEEWHVITFSDSLHNSAFANDDNDDEDNDDENDDNDDDDDDDDDDDNDAMMMT